MGERVLGGGMSNNVLFEPIKLGGVTVKNRIFMAPLTRCRAGAGNVPTQMNARYYAQRAEAGLIIAEATSVSPRGFGYPSTPGIFTKEQAAGWRIVTDAVHALGGLIFLQLWHVGRISHPAFQPNGELPVAPSALAPKGKVFTGTGLEDYVTPRELREDEIAGIVGEYAQGARLAKEAGFDGVEVHAANGYLIDQFLRDGTNQRTDGYGGTVEKRCRLAVEVTKAVAEVWGANRMGIRLSPGGVFNDMQDSDPERTFGTLLGLLEPLGLAYAHITRVTAQDVAHGAKDGIGPKELRKYWKGNLVTAGGFDRAQAEQAIGERWADAVAFGVPFLANPDLVKRMYRRAPLNTPDEATFYGGGEKGYVDYPEMG